MSDIDSFTNDIHHDDVFDLLKEIPESTVHSCITSPPYFAQRDYGVEGQIGLESSVQEYVDTLVSVGRLIRRVLRDDGCWFLNIGDTFSGGGGMQGVSSNHDGIEATHSGDNQPNESVKRQLKYRRKNKLLIPQRVAIALQEDGWIIRNNLVWVKTNNMPESVKDRFTTRTERLYFLTPKPDYWFDIDSIREPHETQSIKRANRGVNAEKWSNGVDGDMKHSMHEQKSIQGNLHPKGKNPGDVLELATKSYSKSHFATFPPKLIEKPLQASCPPVVCDKCGKPYDRENITKPIWEVKPEYISRSNSIRALELAEKNEFTVKHFEAARAVGIGNLDQSDGIPTERFDNSDETIKLATELHEKLGSYYREFLNSVTFTSDSWEQSCDCDTDKTQSGIVIDPFCGSGTTCELAKQHNRRFIGIELNDEYVSYAQERVGLSVDNPEHLIEEGQQTIESFSNE